MASQDFKWSKCRRVAAVLMVASVGVCSELGRAWAQQQPRPITPATGPAPAAANGEPVIQDEHKKISTIELTVGQSRILTAPWPVKRVSVADPAIADVDLSSPTRIQLKGKAVGISEVTLFSERGDSWQAKLDVKADVSRLQDQLRKLFANDSIQVTQIDDVIAIKGRLAQVEDVAQLRQFLKLSEIRYLDMTSVAGLQQVQLQVKVAEVSRVATRMLSSDYAFSDFTGSVAVNNGASATYNPTTPVGDVTRSLPGGTTIFGTGMVGGTTFEYFLKALAENQYIRILAEPTLVARSGQEAQFLAGGEFPIPIAQIGGGNTTQISIEYKEFGVRLRFTPTVLGDGRITLKVAPEVSQLSDVGAVELLGTRIPSVLTRRVETTLDLQSGQTFAIAGLLDQKDNASVAKTPLLGDLPILGPMFRSVRYSREDTEMLVLVTASLVEPSSNELYPTVPGDLHVVPNDWELYAMGRIQGRPAARVAPAQKERLGKLGLDRLRGPGAWATYEDGPKALAGDSRP